METLTEEQITEFRAAFALFDRDGDGQITTRDLSNAMQALNMCPSHGEIQDMINEIDMQGDGCIGFIDFLNLMARRMHETDAMQQMKDALKVFDRDGNGLISVHHFRQVMRQMPDITDSEIGVMIQESDPDRTGLIDYQALVEKIIKT